MFMRGGGLVRWGALAVGCSSEGLGVLGALGGAGYPERY